LADPQVLYRNMVVMAEPLKTAGNQIKMSAFDDPTSRKPAPDLDADRENIIRELLSRKG